MHQGKPLLEVSGLNIAFGRGKRAVQCTDGVSLTVHPGEIVCLVGESGCGKSITALSVMGLLPRQGRVTGVALGDCEITCASEEIGTVQAKAVVHVQQPVKKVTFSPAPAVYNDETAQLTCTIEPENASNPKLTFVSSNEKILTVDENGVVTGVSGGEATVTATTTDGSRRQAKIKVKVMQHLTGVHMLRKTAYIDYGQTSSAGAILEPERAKNVNPNMTWESANPSVASVAQNKKAPNKVDITGVAYGDTEVYGTTEDGGFRTSIKVKVGDWENSLKWVEGKFDARCNLCFAVKNVSELNITSITLVMECFDFDGNELCNSFSRGECRKTIS